MIGLMRILAASGRSACAKPAGRAQAEERSVIATAGAIPAMSAGFLQDRTGAVAQRAAWLIRPLLGLALAALLPTAPVFAQSDYPSRPIRIVVPYPAGGATDSVARTVGERLSKALGQPVVVDNRSGAAGAIGSQEVSRARPDGYTLLMTITDTLINNTVLYKSLSYDPRKDFIGITQVVRSPALISTHAASGIGHIDDMKDKSGASRLSYASWGVGGLGHLALESLNRGLNAGMVHVPHRGEGPVVTDLLSASIDIGISSVASAMQHVPTKKVLPLAVLGEQRSTSLPQVPTMRELGYKDPIYNSNVWIALLAPARTPDPIRDRLTREVREIVASEEVTRRFVEQGFEVMNTSPEAFASNYSAEFDLVTRRIHELGIEPQ